MHNDVDARPRGEVTVDGLKNRATRPGGATGPPGPPRPRASGPGARQGPKYRQRQYFGASRPPGPEARGPGVFKNPREHFRPGPECARGLAGEGSPPR